jgi:20S proteasome subunit beta 3
MTMNGGSMLAMAGKDCVALAVDKRFGSGSQMVNIAPRHVWTPHPQLMMGFVGLEGDVVSLSEDLQMEVASKRNRALGFCGVGTAAERRISPPALASIASHVLYQRRGYYYVEPLVVGLMEKTQKPFLCAMDMIGAQSFSKSFVCAGAASASLYGTAEALWRPDMEAKELVEVCGRAFQSALERDCLSGYGILVYLISSNGILEFDLVSRND